MVEKENRDNQACFLNNRENFLTSDQTKEDSISLEYYDTIARKDQIVDCQVPIQKQSGTNVGVGAVAVAGIGRVVSDEEELSFPDENVLTTQPTSVAITNAQVVDDDIVHATLIEDLILFSKKRCKIILIASLLLRAGFVSTVVILSKRSYSNSNVNSKVDDASPSPSLLHLPTSSSYPSFAPSCTAQFQLRTSLNTSELSFRKFEASGSGLVSMGELITETENTSIIEFREFFYDQSIDLIKANTSYLQASYDFSTFILSYDGDMIIVGAAKYDDGLGSLGGGLLVYQRENGEWVELYSSGVIASSGFRGRVYQVSADVDVSNIAIIVRPDDGSTEYWLANVFTLPMDTESFLNKKGQSFSVSWNSLVGLSGDGKILLIYDNKYTQISMFEFEHGRKQWDEKHKIDLPDDYEVKEMHISMDGKSILLIPSVTFYMAPIIYRKEEGNWVKYPFNIDIKGKMLSDVYGSISGTGTTASISMSWLNTTETEMTLRIETFIFQKFKLDYERIDYFITQSKKLLGEVGTSSMGDVLVVADDDSLKVLKSIC
jgi:hypothetical protein